MNNQEFAKKCEQYVKQGKCQAECCGCTPFKKEIINNNRSKFQVKPVKEIQVNFQEGTNIFCETEDARCIFLNRNQYLCTIYQERPEICRKFGTAKELMLQCPYIKPNGNLRNKAQIKIYKRKNKQTMKQQIKELKLSH